ncbi:MAG: IS110 family transposase, partial [Acetobacteraceae bacterium]|nr:IS110 family transposase [Acetobacteraceae bacterium]
MLLGKGRVGRDADRVRQARDRHGILCSANDPWHEAMRDLVRARTGAVQGVRRARQQLQGFLLRHGRRYGGRKTWSGTHRAWLAGQRFEHPAQQIVFQDYVQAVEDAERRRDLLTEQ